METITVDNRHGLLDAVARAQQLLRSRDLWWRGQGDSSWSLVPGAHRPGLPDSERNLTARFIQKVPPRYPDHPNFRDFQAWLFLLQHFRFPTRLLDWTESPLIAAYFAATECPTADAVLWAVDPFKLNSLQFGQSVIFSDFSSELAPLFAAPLKQGAPDLPKVAAISSTERNLRMLLQISRFTIHGLKDPLESLGNAEQFLVKFVIPAAAKPTIGACLYDLGIRLSGLFPDLEHLARDILGRKYVPA